MKHAGIYQITNIQNNKCYIGSSINITFRWHMHKYHLNHQKHINKKLQRAWNKYGKEKFTFTILELCEPTKEALESREQYYLDRIQPEYNILKKAYSGIGHPVSIRTREKISMKLQGKQVSEATKLKQRVAKLGKPSSLKGKKLTQEHIEKTARANRGTKRAKKGKLSKEEVFDIYKKIPETNTRQDLINLAKQFNISEAYLRHIIKGTRCGVWFNEYYSITISEHKS